MAEFWELTPRELSATIEGAVWRAKRDRERDVALAWHTVALDRRKRLPTLKQLLHPPETKKLNTSNRCSGKLPARTVREPACARRPEACA